jgi:hypothetical protein
MIYYGVYPSINSNKLPKVRYNLACCVDPWSIKDDEGHLTPLSVSAIILDHGWTWSDCGSDIVVENREPKKGHGAFTSEF